MWDNIRDCIKSNGTRLKSAKSPASNDRAGRARLDSSERARLDSSERVLQSVLSACYFFLKKLLLIKSHSIQIEAVLRTPDSATIADTYFLYCIFSHSFLLIL